MGFFDYWFRRADSAPQPALTVSQVQAPEQRNDSVYNPLTGFGGTYDKGSAGRPDTRVLRLQDQELEALYRFNGYGRRIVDCVAEDCVRAGWTTDGADFSTEDKALDTRNIIKEAVSRARLKGGSRVLMVTSDGAPEKPLPPGSKVLDLVVLEPLECQPTMWGGDPTKPRYKKPILYSVTPIAPGGGSMLSGQDVHWTRLLEFDGESVTAQVRAELNGYGESSLQAAWEAIRSRTTIDQAAAIAAQEMKIDIVKISGLAAKSVGDQAAIFEARMRAFARGRSSLGLTIMAEGDAYESHSASATGFGELSRNSSEQLAAATGLPLTKIFGLAPGGLNADGASQEKNWNALVEAYLESRVRRPLEILYTALGAAKGIAPGSWKLEFLSLDQPTDTELADRDLKKAQADAIYIQEQVLSPEHVAISRFGKSKGGSILPLDESQIAALTEEQALMAPRADNKNDPPVMFVPPKRVLDECGQGLEWVKQHGRGDAAKAIVGANVTPQFVRNMVARFARLETKKGDGWKQGDKGYPSAARIEWSLMGGDAGRDWAETRLAELDKGER